MVKLFQTIGNATKNSIQNTACFAHVVFLWVTGPAALQRPFEFQNGVQAVARVTVDRVLARGGRDEVVNGLVLATTDDQDYGSETAGSHRMWSVDVPCVLEGRFSGGRDALKYLT